MRALLRPNHHPNGLHPASLDLVLHSLLSEAPSGVVNEVDFLLAFLQSLVFPDLFLGHLSRL